MALVEGAMASATGLLFRRPTTVNVVPVWKRPTAQLQKLLGEARISFTASWRVTIRDELSPRQWRLTDVVMAIPVFNLCTQAFAFVALGRAKLRRSCGHLRPRRLAGRGETQRWVCSELFQLLEHRLRVDVAWIELDCVRVGLDGIVAAAGRGQRLAETVEGT